MGRGCASMRRYINVLNRWYIGAVYLLTAFGLHNLNAYSMGLLLLWGFFTMGPLHNGDPQYRKGPLDNIYFVSSSVQSQHSLSVEVSVQAFNHNTQSTLSMSWIGVGFKLLKVAQGSPTSILPWDLITNGGHRTTDISNWDNGVTPVSNDINDHATHH